MIVTRKRNKGNFHIKIGGYEISQEECYQVFRGDVWWFLYLEATYCTVSRNLSNGCWGLSQIRKYANSQMVIKVYVALLYPLIQYCIISWGCIAKSVLDPLNQTSEAYGTHYYV